MAKVSPAKTADADADAKASGMDSDAERYRKAGARYLMTQATHHDHFFNYDS